MRWLGRTKGATPWATLYSAILREIDAKPADSRFIKPGGATSRSRASELSWPARQAKVAPA